MDNTKSVSNDDVKRAFLKRERAHAPNLVSEGERLLSYGWYEIAKWFGDTVWIRTGKMYSQTTASKHMSGLVTLLSLNKIRYMFSPVESDKEAAIMEMPQRWRDYEKNEGRDTYNVLEYSLHGDHYHVIGVEQGLTIAQATYLLNDLSKHYAPPTEQLECKAKEE